jgi:magnesium transporter
MITVKRTLVNSPTNEELSLDTLKPGSWINAVAPTREELETIARLTRAPLDFITAPMDPEESSRINYEEYDEETGLGPCVLIVINIARHLNSEKVDFDTIPLGIVVTNDYVITVCTEGNEICPTVTAGTYNFYTWKRTRFLLQLLYKTATVFLRYINEMNRMSDRLEADLRKSMRNEELFKLIDLERGMTYFTGALRGNRVVVDKLLRIFSQKQYIDLVKIRSEDEDLLEDVKIEYDQAYDMVRLYSDVISGMMDAFASIISNNLNIVMKFLASVTIIMSVPTAISSLWGMNVPVPFSGWSLGFWVVMGISISVSAFATWLLWRKRLF